MPEEGKETIAEEGRTHKRGKRKNKQKGKQTQITAEHAGGTMEHTEGRENEHTREEREAEKKKKKRRD
jgi:hypothetical protein